MTKEYRMHLPCTITKDGATVTKQIPISVTKRIAEEYDYDQVIVIARKIGDAGSEAVTTYGVDKDNCDVAARIGDYLKYEIMNWVRLPQEE